MGRPTWRGRRTLALSQHPCCPERATSQAAFPRTGSMQASYLQPSPLAWEEVGHITVPRPAGGDQRLRLAQGPGKSAPSLCQPLSAKQRSVCSAWTPSPIPGLTQPRLVGGSTPGQVQSQKPGTVPKGGRSKSQKEQNCAAARGLSQWACPPAPTLVARRVGLRGCRLRAAWIFPRGRGCRRILAPGGAQVGTGAESRGRIPGTNPSLGTFWVYVDGGAGDAGAIPTSLHLRPVLLLCPRGPPTASLQTDIKFPRPRGNRAPPRLAAGTDPLSRLPVL